MARLTLATLHELAIAWCPRKARWLHLLNEPNTWGPAHEIGHALIEPRWRWKMRNYGHCPLGFCQCNKYGICTVYEAAAMMISARLLSATGNTFMAEREADDTTDYDYIEPHHWRRAKDLLRRKSLWPVPRTRGALEAALKRKLRRPRGGRLPNQPKPPVTLLRLFAR